MIPQSIIEKCDYCDLRVDDTYSESMSFKNGKIISNGIHKTKKYGVRVFINGSWGLAGSEKEEDLSLIFESAYRIARIANQKSKLKFKISGFSELKDKKIIKVKNNPMDLSTKEKLKTIKEFDILPHKVDRNISTSTNYGFITRNKKFYNSLGAEIEQEIPRISINSSQTMKDKSGGMVHEYTRKAGIGGFNFLDDFARKVSDTSKELKKKIDYQNPPKGKFDILLDSSVAGLFFHEGVGHACEADACLKSISVLKGKVGKKITNEKISLDSNPLVRGGFGFYYYDDEGVKAKRVPLIKEGVLVGYMHNLETASRMNVTPSSNGRSQTPFNQIIPRMNNLVINSGDLNDEELLEVLKDGYYVKGFGGGVVNPINGEFSFKVSKVFRVENSKISQNFKEGVLSGNILTTLQNIIGVGKKSVLSPSSSGFCGKDGQMAEVDEKMPKIVVKGMSLG